MFLSLAIIIGLILAYLNYWFTTKNKNKNKE